MENILVCAIRAKEAIRQGKPYIFCLVSDKQDGYVVVRSEDGKAIVSGIVGDSEVYTRSTRLGPKSLNKAISEACNAVLGCFD